MNFLPAIYRGFLFWNTANDRSMRDAEVEKICCKYYALYPHCTHKKQG